MDEIRVQAEGSFTVSRLSSIPQGSVKKKNYKFYILTHCIITKKFMFIGFFH